jgi:hypothetical protein
MTKMVSWDNMNDKSEMTSGFFQSTISCLLPFGRFVNLDESKSFIQYDSGENEHRAVHRVLASS